MVRMPDKWIYAIERVNVEPEVKDHSNDWRYNINHWKWDEAYDSLETLRKMYTRGEAVDMIFNKNYVFVKYLATQYYTWDEGIVTFMKNSTLQREVMTLDEIWDKLPNKISNCENCDGGCAQCIYRKVDTKVNNQGQMVVKNIHCLYDINDKMLQSMAKGNHYCKHFTCLHTLSKHNKSRCQGDNI